MQSDAYFYGFPRWKRSFVERFFRGHRCHFVQKTTSIPTGQSLYVWGMALNEDEAPKGVQLIRIEDGFMRSVGLGAERTPPLSWVLDPIGLYYDATRPSGLEQILAAHAFDAELLQRAQSLKTRLIKNGITKYNVDNAQWQRPNITKRIILVPGQVESDQSIQYGAPKDLCPIRTNLQLLKSVKHRNPDAYIIYKPHPDVVAGFRAQGKTETETAKYADEVITNASMSHLLDQVDEVHTITSLAGFEALIRGKSVTCYGQPFYSGWQLTNDLYPCTRRTRSLTVDQLVAGAYILYPTYVSISRNEKCTPEEALDEIRTWRASPSSRSIFKKLLNLLLQLQRY